MVCTCAVPVLQDGYVDQADLQSHIDAITQRNKYPQETLKQLESLYQKAWKRVRAPTATE
jgi:hypothetical protein